MRRRKVRVAWQDGAGRTIVQAVSVSGIAAYDRAYSRLMRLGAVWPLDVHVVVISIP